MVDVDEFVKLQQGEKDESDFKLATVAALFETGTAKIMFFGEAEASEKEYSYLASYKPIVGDTVLVVPFADTYIIAGKLLFKTTASADISYITQDVLNTELSKYTLSTVLQDDYAKKTDLSEFVKSGDTIGNLTMSWLKATYSVSTPDLSHGTSSSSSLGFFGASKKQKNTVSNITTSATPEQVRTALINLITALKDYGLV